MCLWIENEGPNICMRSATNSLQQFLKMTFKYEFLSGYNNHHPNKTDCNHKACYMFSCVFLIIHEITRKLHDQIIILLSLLYCMLPYLSINYKLLFWSTKASFQLFLKAALQDVELGENLSGWGLKVWVAGAARQPALMSCSESPVCHMGWINPPAFSAAHQSPSSLPVHAVKMIILPGCDDEDIIFTYTHKQTAVTLTGDCTAVDFSAVCRPHRCSIYV